MISRCSRRGSRLQSHHHVVPAVPHRAERDLLRRENEDDATSRQTEARQCLGWRTRREDTCWWSEKSANEISLGPITGEEGVAQEEVRQAPADGEAREEESPQRMNLDCTCNQGELIIISRRIESVRTLKLVGLMVR